MGGVMPDGSRVENQKLVVDDERRAGPLKFARVLETGSDTERARELAKCDIRTARGNRFDRTCLVRRSDGRGHSCRSRLTAPSGPRGPCGSAEQWEGRMDFPGPSHATGMPTKMPETRDPLSHTRCIRLECLRANASGCCVDGLGGADRDAGVNPPLREDRLRQVGPPPRVQDRRWWRSGPAPRSAVRPHGASAGWMRWSPPVRRRWLG